MFELCDVPIIWYDDFARKLPMWSTSWKTRLGDWVKELPTNVMPIPSETEREELKKAHEKAKENEADEIEMLELEIKRMKHEQQQKLEEHSALRIDLDHGVVSARNEFKLSKLLKEIESLATNIDQMDSRLAKLKNVSKGCFSPSSMVQVKEGGFVRMKNLR
ncbi:MAG: hypothetical protein SGARI_003930, partial [Bacillariaceae sp.]